MNPGVGPLWRRHVQRRKKMLALGHAAEYRRRAAYIRIGELILSVRSEYPLADEDAEQNEQARLRIQRELGQLRQRDGNVALVLDDEPSWPGGMVGSSTEI